MNRIKQTQIAAEFSSTIHINGSKFKVQRLIAGFCLVVGIA